MRGLRSTLVLLVVALGLGGYIFFFERHRPPASAPEPNEQLFDFEADDVAELRVDAGEDAVTELRRTDDAWQVVAPIEAAADDSATSSIASTLASLEVQRVVEEGPVDLEPFGLAAPALDIGFTLADAEAPRHLLIGEQTPTGGDRYAKLGDSDRVFLIAGYLNSTFDKSTFDLRDKTVLDFERGDLDGLEITAGDRVIRFAQDGDDWLIVEPLAAGADFSTVEGLIGSLSNGRMRSVESETADALESFGLAEPAISVALSAGSASATLHVGDETPDGARYARDASRPLVFTIDASLVTSLEREAAEYRRKGLFAFRSFNATRLEVERPDGTVVFEKVEAETDEEEDAWHRTEPGSAEVPRADMDSLLSQVSVLRAESFVASRADAGLGPEQVAATIRARFGEDGTEEQVTVWRSGEDTYAVRGDESGAGQIDSQAFDAALDALEALQDAGPETSG